MHGILLHTAEQQGSNEHEYLHGWEEVDGRCALRYFRSTPSCLFAGGITFGGKKPAMGIAGKIGGHFFHFAPIFH